MATRYVTLIFVLVFVSKHGLHAALCDDCTCLPKDEPLSVHCNCSTRQTLDLTHRRLSGPFGQTTNFTVSGCEGSVVFYIDSFKELHALQNLKVYNVNQVIFQPGVFQALSHLELENIQQLNFTASAFNGGQMDSVHIKQSNIAELRKHSFYNIKSLGKFFIYNSVVDTIESQAIMLKNNTEFSVVNTIVNNIESEAISVESKEFIIHKSVLKNLKDNALNITATDQFIISETESGENLPNNPIIVSAPVVNISNNHFKFLSLQILRNINGKMQGDNRFINNTIDIFESDKPIDEEPATWTAYGNHFQCSCALFEIFKNTKSPQLVMNNFCTSSCRIPLDMAAKKCTRPSISPISDKVLCDSYSTLQPSGSSRSPRGRDFTTFMPETTTTNRSNSACGIIFLPLLLWGSIILILF